MERWDALAGDIYGFLLRKKMGAGKELIVTGRRHPQPVDKLDATKRDR